MPNYRLVKYEGKLLRDGNRLIRRMNDRHKRFLTAYDMAEAKKAEARCNAQFKRKERESRHKHMIICGCGSEGCLFCV